MIQIDLVLGEDLRIIDADPAQIEQVLLNLGVNAQHAMPDGGQLLIETNNVSLRDEYIRKHLGAIPGHYVLLTISDTGAGMGRDVLDRIYEPFFTTKPTWRYRPRLVHCPRKMAQHGGTSDATRTRQGHLQNLFLPAAAIRL
jgi:signal transduction histidine kinase